MMRKALVISIRIALIALIVAANLVEEHFSREFPYAGFSGFIANIFPFVSILITAWLGGRMGFVTAPLPGIAVGIYDYFELDPTWKEYTNCWAGSLIGSFVLGLPVGCVTSLIHHYRGRRP